MDDSNKVTGQSTNSYSPEINVPPVPNPLPSDQSHAIPETPVSSNPPVSNVQQEPIQEQQTQSSSEPVVSNTTEEQPQILNVHHNTHNTVESTSQENPNITPETTEQVPSVQEEIPTNQGVEIKEKKKKNIPVPAIVLIVLALLVLGYFVGKQYIFNGEGANKKDGSGDETQGLVVLPNDGTAPKADKTQPDDICISEKEDILSMIQQFEEFQKEKEALSVLALFTKPESEEEKADLANLDGTDSGLPPRLYNNVSTNYSTDSYTVISDPVKAEKSNECKVIVEELRAYYGGQENPEYTSPLAKSFTLVVKKVDDKWMIDSYQSSDKGIKQSKYSGFLMEIEE